jgi:hypothetical protein
MTIHDEIKAKCRTCLYGVRKGSYTLCTHFAHPGYMGGTGTEWVLHCPQYVKDNPKIIDEVARYESQEKTANAVYMLYILLAVIHRDGGHYTAQHGLEKSVKDAIQIVSDLIVK